MKIYDLSHRISNDSPVFPGDPKICFEKTAKIDRDGYMLHKIVLGSHAAVHVDAPAHIIKGGRTIDQFPLEYFTGRAFVAATKRDSGGFIIPEIPDENDFEHLIIHSGHYKKWGSDDYFVNFPLLAPQTAAALSRLPLKTIAIDTPSIDAAEDHHFPLHRLFLGKEILIIENVTNLEPLAGSYVELFAFPLNLEGLDGAPLRAAAIVE
jgi:kynurenine formamidase